MRILDRFRWWLCSQGVHSWRYRNPADRQCKRCRYSEVKFSMSMVGGGWWEQVYPMPLKSPYADTEGESDE